MHRYVTGPARAVYLDDPDNGLSVTSHEVILQDDDPRPTGLLDADGRQLYRVRHREPFGFVK